MFSCQFCSSVPVRAPSDSVLGLGLVRVGLFAQRLRERDGKHSQKMIYGTNAKSLLGEISTEGEEQEQFLIVRIRKNKCQSLDGII